MNDQELSSLLDFIKTETKDPASKTANPSSDVSSAAPISETESPLPKEKAPFTERNIPAVPTIAEDHTDSLPPQSDPVPKPSEKRKQTFRELLDETIEEPVIEAPAASISAESKKRIREALLGLVLVLFAVIGIVFCIQKAADSIKNGLSRKTAEQELTKAVEQTVLPLVVMDIPPFSSSQELEESHRISAAIWSIIVQDQLRDYPESMGMYTVPEGDITAHVIQLFGNDALAVHQTISFSNEIRFYYDSENKVYYINEASVLFSYHPIIRSVRKSEDDENCLLAEVAYAAEQPSWRDDQPDEIAKVVEFTLYPESDGHYRIAGMRQLVDDATENAPY